MRPARRFQLANINRYYSYLAEYKHYYEYALFVCCLVGATIPHFGWACTAQGATIGLCSKAGARWTGVTCDDAYRVVSINLFNYGLSGGLPQQIHFLSALTALDLHHNSLVGGIPSQIGLMTALQYLALSDNAFTGTIPTEFGLLVNIMSLYLFGNSISGTIPSSLCSVNQFLVKFFPCNGVDSYKCRDIAGCIPRCLSNITYSNYAQLDYCTPGLI